MAAAPTADGSPPVLPRRQLTTRRSAAIAGILFAVLLGTSLVLLRLSVPSQPQDAGLWLSDPDPSAQRALGPEPRAVRRYRVPVVHRRGPRSHRRLRGPLLLDGVPWAGGCFPGFAVRRHRGGGGLVESYATDAAGSDVWTFGRASTYASL